MQEAVEAWMHHAHTWVRKRYRTYLTGVLSGFILFIAFGHYIGPAFVDLGLRVQAASDTPLYTLMNMEEERLNEMVERAVTKATLAMYPPYPSGRGTATSKSPKKSGG